jgi:hypothetical protein
MILRLPKQTPGFLDSMSTGGLVGCPSSSKKEYANETPDPHRGHSHCLSADRPARGATPFSTFVSRANNAKQTTARSIGVFDRR